MRIISSLYELLVRDIVRVYQLLDGKLRRQVWWLFFCMILNAGLECFAITTLAFLGMSIASAKTTASQPFFSFIFKLFPLFSRVSNDSSHFVLFTAVICFFIFALKNVLSAYVGWCTGSIGERISFSLSTKIVSKFLYSPYMWHISSDSARMHQVLTGNQFLAGLLVQLLNTHTYALTALALFITLLSSTPDVIFYSVFLTSLCAVFIYKLLRSKIDTAAAQNATAQRDQTRAMINAMQGIREVLIYRQQKVFYKAYADAFMRGSSSRCFLSIAPPIPTWVLESVGIGIIPLSVWLLIIREGADMARLAAVVSLVLLTAWRILPMVNRALAALISVRATRPLALVSIETLEKMISQPSVELPEPDATFKIRRSIELRNVSFRYPGARSDTLRDINISLPLGKQVGVVGLSGSGKSTLAGLLSGLLEPSLGHLLVDGSPLDKPQLSAYMLGLGYVPQTPYIMPGTIAENVAFSKWGMDFDIERVSKACQNASLEIVNDGDGIYTVVGEGGTGLSGGQAQRVSLARALYCDPKLLILDEATSSLDQSNEANIMASLSHIRECSITVIIAHRLSTVENCDYVIWLDQGIVRMSGEAKVVLPLYRKYMSDVGDAEMKNI